MTCFLPYAIALTLSVAACAPIKSEVRETVLIRGPVESYRGPPSTQTPVVLGQPTDSTVDIRVELVQQCSQVSRQARRIRRETIHTPDPYVLGTELAGGLVLTAVPAVACVWGEQCDEVLDPPLAFLVLAGPALLVSSSVDLARSRDSVEDLDTIESHTDVVQCFSQPAGPIPIVVRFSDSTTVETQLDEMGTVSVPLPPSLLADKAAGFAEVAIGGAWRARIQIPRR